MSNKRPASTPTRSVDDTIDITHLRKRLFFCTGRTKMFGSVDVNNANSPGGKHGTKLYSEEMTDVDGQKVVFEAWGKDSVRTDTYFSTNTGSDGMVYVNTQVDPSILHFDDLNIDRKFVLNTVDDSSKRDLSLTLTGMPKPFTFVPGKFKIDGVIISPPEQWHTRFTPVEDNFNTVILPVDYSDL
jgi:hypothetical protein